jgi:hypothetical protein
VWSLQNAKYRFSAVVDVGAHGEPQLVTRNISNVEALGGVDVLNWFPAHDHLQPRLAEALTAHT